MADTPGSEQNEAAHKEWPPYRVGNRDYIHALGVIASVYNLLEFRFRSLFPIYTGLPSQAAYVLFRKSSNEARLELIQNTLQFSSHPDSIKDDVRHFLSGFRISAENRNILMHSTVMYLFGPDDNHCPAQTPWKQPQGVAFQKSPNKSPFEINTYKLSLDEIRSIADAMKAFELYGDNLFFHVLKNYEPDRYKAFGLPEDAQFPLPNRPAVPKTLIPTPPDSQQE